MCSFNTILISYDVVKILDQQLDRTEMKKRQFYYCVSWLLALPTKHESNAVINFIIINKSAIMVRGK